MTILIKGETFIRVTHLTLKTINEKLANLLKPLSTDRSIAFHLYPILILFVLFCLTVRPARAGHVRKLLLSQTQPGVVHLALGRTTAVSFSMKPEKLALGSPNKVHVDFLNKDLAISPLERNPGNLLVYTKSGRYVILFELGSETNYDDVVEVSLGGSQLKGLYLDRDAFHLEGFEAHFQSRFKTNTARLPQKVMLLTSDDRRHLTGDDLSELLKPLKKARCQHCEFKRSQDQLDLYCLKPIENEIDCESSEFKTIRLRRL